ncbi:MAG TPA: hypothetical protein PL045_00645 [Chitinophagaceae bacterium]|nr:hypothetical protein [Chitinophagaceae bacterium]
MTTDQAFQEMIHTRGIYKILELHRGTVGKIKDDIKTGRQGISLDKKIEMLQKAGYKIAQEMIWKK